MSSDILKHPALLGGALVLGLVIFAMSKGGARSSGEGRLAAAIESQRIATAGNVQLSQIGAARDVGMANAMNARAAVAADREIQGAQAVITARALTLSHAESMRGFDVGEKLGTLQLNHGREVALAGIARDVYGVTKAAEVKHAELAVANTINARQAHTTNYLAELSGTLQRDLFAANHRLLTDPAYTGTVTALATIDAERQKAIATINAEAAWRAQRENTITKKGGDLFDDLLGAVGGFFGGGGGGSSSSSSGGDFLKTAATVASFFI